VSAAGAPGEEQRALVPPSLAEDAHKGDAGRVLCLVGSRLMPGAAVLVARAAQRAGAGLVCVGAREREVLAAVAVAAPEAVHLDLAAAGSAVFAIGARADHALVLGCGLGVESARELFGAACAANRAVPIVLDADALNAVAGEPERLRDWPGPRVLTPHPGEAARLLGRALGSGADERAAAARELAQRSGGICCLKGARSVVSDGTHLYVNDTGNPGMATAGAGDVLAGILGAYLALCARGAQRDWTPLDAACAAVRVHGLAGDLAAAHQGRRGLVASDLIAWLPAAQRRLEG
jgi:hydroxyethylthiazole kinase-like uncharacterized protein yjeF